MVTFTGSSQAGSAIASMAGQTMKHVVLECGGKSAAVVLEDADVEDASRTIAGANFMLSGQYCRALSRVLAPRARYKEVVEALAAEASRITVGDPFDERTQMGPLVSGAQRERTERYIALGIEEGARLVTGGKRPGHLPVGYYVQPAVFADVRNSMRIAQEEIFGPVVSVIPYDRVGEAVEIANDCAYGLSGAVFTTDVDAGLRVASAIETGLIGINAQGARESVPCGGVKLSGLGDEHGPEGFREFLRPKAVIIPDTLAARLEKEGVPVTGVGAVPA
jgi:betaine-aldehyde dehydrogenase